MDLCRLALSAGCGFIARSFSGDAKQLSQLLKLALTYTGFAFIDVISPCVAYGNEEDFPHSFTFMKEGKSPLHSLDIITEQAEINIEFKEGEVQNIPLSDGRFLILKKLKDKGHDPTQKDMAWQALEASSKNRETVTGLIYYKEQDNFLDKKELSQKALTDLEQEELRPKPTELERILENYK